MEIILAVEMQGKIISDRSSGSKRLKLLLRNFVCFEVVPRQAGDLAGIRAARSWVFANAYRRQLLESQLFPPFLPVLLLGIVFGHLSQQ
jgi:hypothetical protein